METTWIYGGGEQNEISCVAYMNVARVNFVAAGGWNMKVQNCEKKLYLSSNYQVIMPPIPPQIML